MYWLNQLHIPSCLVWFPSRENSALWSFLQLYIHHQFCLVDIIRTEIIIIYKCEDLTGCNSGERVGHLVLLTPPPADIMVTTGNVSLLTRSGLTLVNEKRMFLCPFTARFLSLCSSFLLYVDLAFTRCCDWEIIAVYWDFTESSAQDGKLP